MFAPLHHNLCPLVARPPAFTPQEVAGLKLWLKADALTGLGDGDPVSTWTDSSGGGNHATGSGASRPAYRTGVLAGAPVLRFDGADDRLALPNLLAGASAATALFVCRVVNDPPALTARTAPPLANFGNNGFSADHYPFTDGVIYHDFGSNARKTVGDPAASLASWHVAAFRSAANDWKAWLNGSLLFATASNTVGFGTAPNLGAAEGLNGPFFFDGDLAEVVVYNAALSDDDRQRVERYLGGKYGIAVA
jgi:hypothetical protein